MPVSDNIANGYIQLGVAGAALLIVLVVAILIMQLLQLKTKQDGKVNDNLSKLQFTKLDKLCDKIDGLISSNAEYSNKLNAVLLSNDKDQKEVINKLDIIMGIAVENQRRIARIDDRTFKCLGNVNHKGDENNDN